MVILLIAMVTLAALGYASLFSLAAIVPLVAIFPLKLLSWTEALQSIRPKLLILIAASFGLATALEKTGVAAHLAAGLSAIFRRGGAYTSLLGIFLATNLLSLVISNAAAAAIMYPIAKSLAEHNDLISQKAVLYCLMAGASLVTMTPISYQTHIFVWKAGGYTWAHFLCFGAPLFFMSLGLTPLITLYVWPAAPLILANATNLTTAL